MTTITSNVLFALVNSISTREREDGTTAGKFTLLKANDFSSRDVFNAYKQELRYALDLLVKASRLDGEEKARIRNMALNNHLLPAYKLLEKEMLISGAVLPEFGLTLTKKQVESMMFCIGQLKIDYSTGSNGINARGENVFRKMVELDVSNIINGRERWLGLRDNVKLTERIAKQEERDAKKAEREKAKAEKEAAKQEAKPDAKPEAGPTEVKEEPAA